MDSLRPIWDATTSFAGGDVGERWWGLISTKYTDEGRIYHNPSYLKQLFSLYDKYEEKFSNSQAVALAIFFHKFEYNPRSNDGENKSLEKFKKFMIEAGDGQEDSCLSNAVCSLIEASSTNLTEAHMTKGKFGCDDVHFFLDLILAILGSPEEEYIHYKTKIQAEYSHMSSSSYNQLRLKILKNLLLIPNVYATKEFQDAYEIKARNNIEMEISKLSK